MPRFHRFTRRVLSGVLSSVLLFQPILQAGAQGITPDRNAGAQAPGVVASVAAGMVPVVMVMEVEPTAATTVPPAQVVLAAGDAATVNPAPIVVRRSVNWLMVAAEPNWLRSVMVRLDVPPGASVEGEKALATDTTGCVPVSVVLTGG